MLEEACANAVLDFSDRIMKLFRDCLALQRVDSVRVCGSGHDDKSDDGDLGTRFLKSEVQTWIASQCE